MPVHLSNLPRLTREQAGVFTLHPNQGNTPSGTVRLASGQLVFGARHFFMKANAVAAKQSGGGGVGDILRDLGGSLGQDLINEILDRLRGRGGGGERQPQLAGCPNGQIEFKGKCIDLGAIVPGGDPLISTAGGEAVSGAFGFPATVPESRSRTTRSCGPRMVLGFDNLCYPKAVLPPRSKFRKWRRAPRPMISRRDEVALRRSKGARERLAEAAKDAGLFVSKSPRRASKTRSSPAAHMLKVVHEETN